MPDRKIQARVEEDRWRAFKSKLALKGQTIQAWFDERLDEELRDRS